MSEQQKSKVGIVTSNKMNKTIVVEIERQVPHRIYDKKLKLTTRLHVHDPDDQCQIGDKVRVMECRPISKTKAWKLVEIIDRAAK